MNIRLRARGRPPKPAFPEAEELTPRMPDAAVLGETDVVFDSEMLKALMIDRDKLLPGNHVIGPAVITEYSSTLTIPPFARGQVDPYGNLVFDING